MNVADKVKTSKHLQFFEKLISYKMVSKITTFSKNLKTGETVHGLSSSLMLLVTLKSIPG